MPCWLRIIDLFAFQAKAFHYSTQKLRLRWTLSSLTPLRHLAKSHSRDLGYEVYYILYVPLPVHLFRGASPLTVTAGMTMLMCIRMVFSGHPVSSILSSISHGCFSLTTSTTRPAFRRYKSSDHEFCFGTLHVCLCLDGWYIDTKASIFVSRRRPCNFNLFSTTTVPTRGFCLMLAALDNVVSITTLRSADLHNLLVA